MIRYELVPYQGVLPITFEMTPADVAALLGPPELIDRSELDERNEARGGVAIRYDSGDNKVCEMAFLPGVPLYFNGRSLFLETDPIGVLKTFDRTPLLIVGFVVFFKLGLTLTGFHDDDNAEQAITAFRLGRWDDLKGEGSLL